MVFVVARVEVVVGVRRHVVLEVIEVEVGGVKVEVLAGLDVEVWFSVELLDGVQGVLGIRCGFVLGIAQAPVAWSRGRGPTVPSRRRIWPRRGSSFSGWCWS